MEARLGPLYVLFISVLATVVQTVCPSSPASEQRTDWTDYCTAVNKVFPDRGSILRVACAFMSSAKQRDIWSDGINCVRFERMYITTGRALISEAAAGAHWPLQKGPLFPTPCTCVSANVAIILPCVPGILNCAIYICTQMQRVRVKRIQACVGSPSHPSGI